MDNLNFHLRSPLLRAVPVNRRRIIRRLVIVVVPLTLLFAIALSVGLRVWDKNGYVRFLYIIHDGIYLWLKGHIHTQHYPEILIVWGVALTLFTAIVVSWIIGYLLIRQTHEHLIRLALRGRLPGLLSASLWVFKKLHVQPHLIWRIAIGEHEHILADLCGTQPVLPSHFRHAASVMRFLLRLESGAFFEPAPIRTANMVDRWSLTYLLLRVYGGTDTSGLEEPFTVFAPTKPDDDLLTTQQQPFHLNVLIAELNDLIANTNDQACTIRLIDASEKRRVLLERMFTQLQNKAANMRPSNIRDQAMEPIVNSISLDVAAMVGRTARTLALLVAARQSDEYPGITRAYFDACDSVYLVTEAFHPQLDAAAYPSEVYRLYACLAGYAGDTFDDPYPILHHAGVQRVLAGFEQNNLKARQDAWQGLRTRVDQNFSYPLDFDFEGKLVAADQERTDLHPPIIRSNRRS